MASWGDGAANGLMNGFKLAMDVNQQRRENTRQDAQDARQAGLDTRATEDHDRAVKRTAMSDQLTATSAQIAEHGKMWESLTKSGQPIDEPTKRRLTETGNALKNQQQQLWAQMGGYDPNAMKANAQVGQQVLQTGDLSKMAPGMFSQTIAATTDQPPSFFLRGPNGEPSQADQSIADVEEGLQKGDHTRLLRGANVLLAREVGVNNGKPAREGGTQVGARLTSMIPVPGGDPANPQFVPGIRIYTNNGRNKAVGGESGDDIRTRRMTDADAPRDTTGSFEQPGAPMGLSAAAVPAAGGLASDTPALPPPASTSPNGAATFPVAAQGAAPARDPQAPADASGHFDSMVTRDRSSDPNDPPQPISMKAAMDRVGQYKHLVELMNTPQAAALLKQDADTGWSDDVYQRSKASFGVTDYKPEKESFTLGANQTRFDLTKNAKGEVTSTKTWDGPDKPEPATLIGMANDRANKNGTDPVAELAKIYKEIGGAPPGAASLNSAGTKASNADREAARKEQKDATEAAEKLARGAQEKVKEFDSYKPTPQERRDDKWVAERAARRTLLTKKADESQAYFEQLATRQTKPLPGDESREENKIPPAEQAKRDLEAGRIIMNEDKGGAATAPARLLVLRNAAANAKDSETKQIMGRQADMLEMAIKGGDAPAPKDRKPLASFGADTKPKASASAAAPAPAPAPAAAPATAPAAAPAPAAKGGLASAPVVATSGWSDEKVNDLASSPRSPNYAAALEEKAKRRRQGAKDRQAEFRALTDATSRSGLASTN